MLETRTTTTTTNTLKIFKWSLQFAVVVHLLLYLRTQNHNEDAPDADDIVADGVDWFCVNESKLKINDAITNPVCNPSIFHSMKQSLSHFIVDANIDILQRIDFHLPSATQDNFHGFNIHFSSIQGFDNVSLHSSPSFKRHFSIFPDFWGKFKLLSLFYSTGENARFTVIIYCSDEWNNSQDNWNPINTYNIHPQSSNLIHYNPCSSLINAVLFYCPVRWASFILIFLSIAEMCWCQLAQGPRLNLGGVWRVRQTSSFLMNYFPSSFFTSYSSAPSASC